MKSESIPESFHCQKCLFSSIDIAKKMLSGEVLTVTPRTLWKHNTGWASILSEKKKCFTETR